MSSKRKVTLRRIEDKIDILLYELRRLNTRMMEIEKNHGSLLDVVINSLHSQAIFMKRQGEKELKETEKLIRETEQNDL